MLIAQANQSPPLKKEIEDAIRSDIQRTLTSVGAANKTSLSNVLRIYALFNPAVGYCQGMNFIAEFLLLHFKSEPMAFAFLSTIIERYGMSMLFAEGVPLLRRFLYQMDRLVYFQDSSLMTAFLNEGITSAHFSPPWFMSLFTFLASDGDNEQLLSLWDAFLLYGWKAVFKAGVFAVTKLNKKEENKELVKELAKGVAFQNAAKGEFIENFKKIPVNNRVLEMLSKEYNSILKFE